MANITILVKCEYFNIVYDITPSMYPNGTVYRADRNSAYRYFVTISDHIFRIMPNLKREEENRTQNNNHNLIVVSYTFRFRSFFYIRTLLFFHKKSL